MREWEISFTRFSRKHKLVKTYSKPRSRLARGGKVLAPRVTISCQPPGFIGSGIAFPEIRGHGSGFFSSILMHLRRTKIICTLGPATDTANTIGCLIDSGASIFRLNMSHAAHDWVRTVVALVRSESTSRGVETAILLDLQGPAIRTGDVDTPIALQAGDLVEFRNESLAASSPISVTTNYEGLHLDLSVGNTVLVDNGTLQFRVTSITQGRVLCESLDVGTLGSRRHINLPGVRVNLPALTEKDEHDIVLAAEVGADFVGISFVRDAVHIGRLREKLHGLDSAASIIAKIEDQEAVRHLEEIITASDAVMVARGDLGIEVHLEELPIVQRRIIKSCARIGRPVIVATHMLESMIDNPVPTRAEVTDVANAVFEQADAVMLSGETSIGRYPRKCVETLDRITRRMEQEPGAGYHRWLELHTEKELTVQSAVSLANSLEQASLIVFTQQGLLAKHAANLRPEKALIYAFSPDPNAVRSLVLSRSVVPFHIDLAGSHGDSICQAIDRLRRESLVSAGSPLVIVSDILLDEFDEGSILLRHA